MRDSFKEHIESNRDDFEVYPFDTEEGWNEIAGRFKRKKNTSVWWWMGSAASVIVLIGLVFVLYSPGNATSHEVAEVEGFYQEEINRKISLVKNHLGDDDILADLAAMDAAFAELRSDLNENVDNEEVISAMMENYRLKLRILEEILVELEKEKSESTY